MSFTLVGPGGGWSFGAKLTSAQMNQLDADHANALDKSVAGDELFGVITMASTAAIKVNTSGAEIISSVNGGIQSTIGAGIKSTVNSGILGTAPNSITTSAAGGIAPNVAKGISDGGEVNGIAATVPAGICGTVVNGIAPTVAGGIGDGGIAGGIASSINNGIKCNAGSSDWVGLSTRTILRTKHMRIIAGLASGWINAVSFAEGGATTSYQQFVLEPLIEGATLISVAITFSVLGTHAGGVPAQPPLFSIQRFPVSNGAAYNNSQTLNSSDIGNGIAPGFWPPASGAAWYNSGNNQFMTYTCNQNNIISSELYNYVILIQDENGANSQSGNAYFNQALSYTVTQLNY